MGWREHPRILCYIPTQQKPDLMGSTAIPPYYFCLTVIVKSNLPFKLQSIINLT